MEKIATKFDDIEIEKHKRQHERPISTKSKDFNKIVVSGNICFGKKGCKCFIGYKDAKKVDLHAYFFQK